MVFIYNIYGVGVVRGVKISFLIFKKGIIIWIKIIDPTFTFSQTYITSIFNPSNRVPSNLHKFQRKKTK